MVDAAQILVIKSSLMGADGNSTQLVDQLVEQWKRYRPDDQIETLDFAADPIPHLDRETFLAFGMKADQRSERQQASVALSDQLIEQFLKADAVVMGVPMYNLAIPSTLKAYLDHVARAGKTFRYTSKGAVGLARDRPVFVVGSRGGIYWNTPADLQTPYLERMFALFGIKDLRFVMAEGLAISPENKAASMKRAAGRITDLLDQHFSAAGH